MRPKRLLPKIAESAQALGLPTIMDRALAAEHGATYVHLAVFSIDIDRVYWRDPERNDLPFGWEVFLCEHYLLTHLDATTPTGRDLVEHLCASIMEETPGEPPLGGQIVFAVYDALVRQQLPVELTALFKIWRTMPDDMVKSLGELWKNPEQHLVAFSNECLQTELEPPLAPPTVATLRAWAAGQFGRS